TAYAYGRIYEITGEAPLIKSGNAGSWWFTNKRNNYYEYGSEPKLGAIACWSGHVAVVEAIDGDTVTISESHWRRKYFNTKTYSSPTSNYRQTFYGYIYASDSIFVEEPVYSYTQEVSEFAEIPSNPFAETELTIESDSEPILLMNSHMITNAVG
ncbi:MAG: CHAP domain-containing protein, partial [Eubacterium sp.]|nr:CHAP domain-containing protein [Eubacterium sp.]